MRRQLIATLVTSGVALATVVGVAPGASAETYDTDGYVRNSGCAGRIIDKRTIYSDNSRQRLGQVRLYYSARNGGENCVMTRSWIGRTEMSAALLVRMSKNKDVSSSDYGKYNSYAGGAYRTRTNGHCVLYFGAIWSKKGYGQYVSKLGHCG